MKKVLFFLIVLTGFFGCSKDENAGLQDDVNKLKERLDAIEKGKTVINVEFKDTNMIITYSSGEKVTLPLPKGLDGVNGTNGKDGVGIQTITYDEATAILKITLTNGNTSEFKIVASGNMLTAVLLSDVNGSYLLTSASMGSLNIANITYNDNNQVVSVVNNVIGDRQQVKNFEVTNEYSNGKLVNVYQKQFATANREYWDRNHLSGNIKAYAQKLSSNFIIANNNDGTYSVEIYQGVSYTSNSAQYNYLTNSKAYKCNVISDYEYSVGSQFYQFDKISRYVKLSNVKVVELYDCYVYSSAKRTDGKWDVVVFATSYTERNFIFNVKVGDVVSNNRYSIENNDKGLMSAITLYRNSSITPEYQLRLTYNTANKVVKSEKYVQVSGSWTSTGTYLAYEYNQTNQVTIISRVTPDGKSEKMQETKYDKNGNPIEIYALQGDIYSNDGYEWFNPDKNEFEYGRILVKPAGIRLVAKFEYDYQLKNFFGNTISAINPLLDHYKVVNALKRAWSAEEYGLNGWIDYRDYNEFGYPETMILNGTNMEDAGGESGRLEIRLAYQKKK